MEDLFFFKQLKKKVATREEMHSQFISVFLQQKLKQLKIN
jgi:hypothetical protein